MDQQGNEIQEPDQPTMQELLAEKEMESVYNQNTKVLDVRRLRATQVKNNPRVYLPRGRPQKEEAQFSARETLMEQTLEDYIAEN